MANIRNLIKLLRGIVKEGLDNAINDVTINFKEYKLATDEELSDDNDGCDSAHEFVIMNFSFHEGRITYNKECINCAKNEQHVLSGCG